MSIIDKLNQISVLMHDIEKEDPTIGSVLIDGFGVALGTMQALAEKGSRTDVDISEYLQMVSRAIGVSLEDLVLHIVQKNTGDGQPSKAPDEETLKFITSGLDDYEKFIAQNKAQENLNFLKSNV